ncbi:MAG TPA: DUF4440 domain-containing protein [Flavipsychrobacter sp.]|nr:DUF4440 domain-containing protein [Flavipsychrobacter sp.]
MKKLFALLLLVFGFVLQSCKDDKNDESAIRQMLEKQVIEWNKGNIEGYMRGYWENDSLVFIGRNGPTYGYVPTLECYKKGYPTVEHMGRLISTITSIRRLSDDYYFIIGKWSLIRNIGDVSGAYSLLLRKIHGQWVIVVDHSS